MQGPVLQSLWVGRAGFLGRWEPQGTLSKTLPEALTRSLQPSRQEGSRGAQEEGPGRGRDGGAGGTQDAARG